jgi:NADH-quinone oxidoreductase subunit G
MAKLTWGLIGGGEGSQIGPAHRLGARLVLWGEADFPPSKMKEMLALKDSLGEKAEIFGGSWLPVGKADGIALSGDPVANRAGLKLLGIPDNLDQLIERAGEFDVL